MVEEEEEEQVLIQLDGGATRDINTISQSLFSIHLERKNIIDDRERGRERDSLNFKNVGCRNWGCNFWFLKNLIANIKIL